MGEPSNAEMRVLTAAVNWWKEMRPRDWDAKKHRETPEVNTLTAREEELARAVAAMIMDIFG